MANGRVADPFNRDRLIPRGSTEYNRLVRGDAPRFIDVREQQLRPQVDVGDVIEFELVYNPSDPEQTFVRIGDHPITDNNVQATNRWLRGEGGWNQMIQGADAMPAFFAEFAAEFTIRRPGDRLDIAVRRDFDGEPELDNDPRPPTPEDLRDVQQRADNPLRIPFHDIDINAAPPGCTDEGRCLDRFAGFHVPSKTLRELIHMAKHRRQRFFIFDIHGNIVAKTDHPVNTKNQAKRGITYGGHIYIMTKGQTPVRIGSLKGDTIIQLTDIPDPMPLWLEQHNAMFWRDGGSYYTPMGKVVSVQPREQDWFGPALNLARPSSGWCDPVVAGSLNVATLPLHYIDPCMPTLRQDYDPGDYISLDATKCYWTVFKKLWLRASQADGFMRSYIGLTGVGPLHGWTPFNGRVPLTAADGLVAMPMDKIPIGCRSNVMPAAVAAIAFPDIQPDFIFTGLPCAAKMLDVGPDAYRLMLRIDEDPAAQSLFREVIGCWGRFRQTEDIRIQFPRHDGLDVELQHYVERYEMRAGDNCDLTRVSSYMCPNNRYLVYMNIVLTANLFVWEMIAHIKNLTSEMPVTIKTDAITYRRTPLVEAIINRILAGQDPDAPTHLTWHSQEMPAVDAYVHRNLSPPTDVQVINRLQGIENRVFCGPPGVGKTYLALGLSGELPPPRTVVCYTHRGVARLMETTAHMDSPPEIRTIGSLAHRLHATIDTYDQLRFEFRSGDVIMVDEYQSTPLEAYNIFYFLYMRGVRFRFVGDPNQVVAVNEESDRRGTLVGIDYGGLPEHPVPTLFLGHETKMTINRRTTDPVLLQAIRDIEQQTFVAHEVVPWDAPITNPINLAFRKETVDVINRRYVMQHQLSWGDDGRYIVLRSSPAKKIYEGQILIRTGDEMRRPDGTSFDIKRERMGHGKSFDWGWAMTIHKAVGSTIEEPYSMWDYAPDLWGLDYKRLLYTAVSRARTYGQLEFRSLHTPLLIFRGVEPAKPPEPLPTYDELGEVSPPASPPTMDDVDWQVV